MSGVPVPLEATVTEWLDEPVVALEEPPPPVAPGVTSEEQAGRAAARPATTTTGSVRSEARIGFT
jgi:hypothetical protein